MFLGKDQCKEYTSAQPHEWDSFKWIQQNDYLYTEADHTRASSFFKSKTPHSELNQSGALLTLA